VSIDVVIAAKVKAKKRKTGREKRPICRRGGRGDCVWL